MATTGIGFRWLDILEKEFDKACVELDTSLVELEAEDPEAVFGSRQKIATLSSCFAQLTHKALTIFQNSAKLEAELVDMRAELIEARASAIGGCQDNDDTSGMVSEAARARVEAAQLARENATLRETVLALHSELFGARLATKYLDKELAGRIQQLQLLGREMRSEVRDSLWAQVEAEILLQRHKTLVRVCRGVSPRPPRPAAPAAPPPASHPPRARTVTVRRSPHLGLGISVTGGREHGVPILISELEAGGPADLTGELYVGDAILAINDVDLTQACHKEAVQVLQSVKGDCALYVQFIATDDDDRLSEDNYRFPLYPEEGDGGLGEMYCGAHDGSGATPTAPRTPDYNHRPPSCADSGSECEAPLYAEPYRPTVPYPEYNINSINNNLSILDMDDDSIKIEARLEMAPLEDALSIESPPARRRGGGVRGGYRAVAGGAGGGAGAVGDTSADSPHSTPVHRRPDLKKKRKPQDWRTKGAYRAVAPDAQSSDDTIDNNGTMQTDILPNKVPETPLVPLPPPQEIPIPSQKPPNVSQPLPNSIPLIPETSPCITQNLPNGPNESQTNGVLQTPPDEEKSKRKSQPSLIQREVKHNPNGDVKHVQMNGEFKTARRESKGFRIGSARRVMDSQLMNGETDRTKFPARLIAGDGDPDFGTPV